MSLRENPLQRRGPTCPDHAIPMTRLQPDGAPIHGQQWWICLAQQTITILQRACCGNTTATQ